LGRRPSHGRSLGSMPSSGSWVLLSPFCLPVSFSARREGPLGGHTNPAILAGHVALRSPSPEKVSSPTPSHNYSVPYLGSVRRSQGVGRCCGGAAGSTCRAPSQGPGWSNLGNYSQPRPSAWRSIVFLVGLCLAVQRLDAVRALDRLGLSWGSGSQVLGTATGGSLKPRPPVLGPLSVSGQNAIPMGCTW